VNRNLTHSALCFERAAEAGSAEGMEQLALQLINGAGIRADHKRASQLMKRALSTISSGHAGYGGLRALSKQFVLRYRIAFLW
jgi:TPR repeat protein